MSDVPPTNYLAHALLGDNANAMAMYRDISQRWSTTYPGVGVRSDYPPPNTLSPFALFPHSPYAPQPKFDCKLREAAWIRTAGDVDALSAHDVYGNFLLRNAPPGSVFAWDCDHIIPRKWGGTDDAWNLRALHSSANRSEGDRS